MKILKVAVQNDYLNSMSKARPVVALTEIIWNGFDADAKQVFVYLDYNNLKGLEQIRVLDNGHGIAYEDAMSAFSQLGGSWKVRST